MKSEIAERILKETSQETIDKVKAYADELLKNADLVSKFKTISDPTFEARFSIFQRIDEYSVLTYIGHRIVSYMPLGTEILYFKISNIHRGHWIYIHEEDLRYIQSGDREIGLLMNENELKQKSYEIATENIIYWERIKNANK